LLTEIVGKINTHFMFNNFFREVVPFGRIRQDTDDNIRVIRRMNFACWVIEATDTHSDNAIIITSPRQQ
jgi:hypothetical protein